MQYDSATNPCLPIKKCSRDKQTLYYIAPSGHDLLARLRDLSQSHSGYPVECHRSGPGHFAPVRKAKVWEIADRYYLPRSFLCFF